MKDKLKTAFSSMNPKAKDDAFSWGDDTNKPGRFVISRKEKQAAGRLFLVDDLLVAKITTTNYNQSYLRQKVSNAFLQQGLTNFQLQFDQRIPSSGDVLNTQVSVDDLDEEENHTLKKGTVYYSFDDDPPSCNGRELEEDFQAKFLGTFEDTCTGSTLDEDVYSKFELL